MASDSKSMDPVLKYLAVGRQLGYGFYLLLDAISYFDTTGIYKLQSGARIAKEAYRAWFVGLACNIAAGVYTLYNLQQIAKKQQQSVGDAEKKVEQKTLERYAFRGARGTSGDWMANTMDREKAATQLQLLSDVCDITVPSSAIGMVNLDDGIVGLAGTVSSLIGLTAAWAKTA